MEFITVTLWPLAFILVLAFAQSIAFTMTSRSKNRDHMLYNGFCAVFSNGIWLLMMRELFTAELSFDLFAPYIIGTACGSMFGAKVSMKIEKLLGAKT